MAAATPFAAAGVATGFSAGDVTGFAGSLARLAVLGERKEGDHEMAHITRDQRVVALVFIEKVQREALVTGGALLETLVSIKKVRLEALVTGGALLETLVFIEKVRLEALVTGGALLETRVFIEKV